MIPPLTIRCTKLVVVVSLALLSCATAACDDGTTPPSGQAEVATAKGGSAGTSGTSAGGQPGSGAAAGTGTGGKTSGQGGSKAPEAGVAAGTGAAGAPGENQAGSAGSGGTPPAPSCAKGGFYDFSAKALDAVETVPMCDFAGKVVMVVNVASKCGYTPQYKPLQTLYAKYAEQGFVVLGFPSADFGNQEFADDKDISAFCTGTYGITFPVLSRIDVKGPKQDPIYAWLTKQPGGEGEITWNFNKFLLGRDGVFRERFDTETSPDASTIAKAVEAALALPAP